MDHVDRILEQWRRERPDLDVAPMGTIGRIKRLYDHLVREIAKTAASHGLKLARFDVLATLRRSGDPYALTPRELIASTMVTSGTMTHRIDQLVRAGYVRRVSNADDGRSVLIALTPEGFDVIDAAVTDHVLTESRLTSGLSEPERRRLDRLLKTFLSALEEGQEG